MRSKKTRSVGLARALSKLGYCSRAQAAQLIHAGRVTLNQKICRNPETPVFDLQNHITVDGNPIQPQKKIYIMLNKPRGTVTTASDEKGRATIYDVLRKQTAASETHNSSNPWLAPIGRLDKASEGLLLLTNDSEWGARIAAPETHLDKTYHVQVNTVGDSGIIRALLSGVTTNDGTTLRAKHAAILRAGEKNCWLEIVLDEGKNRQIRRMMETLGAEVLRLVRIAIGPLKLGELAKGESRPVTSQEKKMLDRAMQEERA
jgi:23S rRNA pseudouridine2605 synthase